jgi:hypothetical protein
MQQRVGNGHRGTKVYLLLLLLLLLLFYRCHAPAHSPSLPFTSTQPLRTTPHITIANRHSTTNTITVPITSKPTSSSCA